MASLSSLASELALLIFGYLPQNSLAAVSIASKQLQPLIEPLLYRSMEWTFRQKSFPVYRSEIPNPGFEDEDTEEWEEERGDNQRFILFIRSIAKRPALGRHVVYLRMELKSEDEPVPHLIETTDENRHMLLEEINKMGCPRADLYDGILQGTLDAATCILLPLLLNLKKLDLEYSLAYSWPLLSHMILWLAYPTVSGRNLPRVAWKEVSIINWHLDEIETMRLAGSIGPMRSLFHMASLETVEIVLSDSDILFRILPAHQIPNTTLMLPNLTTLRLLNSEASVATLSQILTRTPNLKVLEYNFVQKLDEDELWEDLERRHGHRDEWGRLTTALTSVASTLKEFIMSISNHYMEDDMVPEAEVQWIHQRWRRRGNMGSLKSFTKLERLEIPVVVLLGYGSDVPPDKLASVLPGTLRELCLRDDLINIWFNYRYEWTPWMSNVDGGRLNESFQQTCDPSPLLLHLTEYLGKVRYQVSGEDEFCLESLVLKQSRDRLWHVSWRQQFQDLVSGSDIVGKFHVQLGDDRVKEIAKVKDAAQEKFRYFNERPKALSNCYL